METLGQVSGATGFHWREIPLLPFSPKEKFKGLEGRVDLRHSVVILSVSALVAAVVRFLSLGEDVGEIDRILASGLLFAYIFVGAVIFSLVSSSMLPSMHRSGHARFTKTLTFLGYCGPWIAVSSAAGTMMQSYLADGFDRVLRSGIVLLDLALAILLIVIVVSAVAVANDTSRRRAFAGAVVGALAVGVLGALAILSGYFFL